MRISAQLVDATTGAHVWADRFDGSLEDVLELQDRVASSVAGVIEPTLQAVETARSAARPTNDLAAYDLYLHAYEMYFASAQEIPEALRLLELAIERDPRYGPALAWAAVCCLRLDADGSSPEPAVDSRKSVDFARRALQVAGDDPGTLANGALALAYYGEDIGAMMTMVDRALALNPSFARGWYIGAILWLFAGQFERAIEFAETSLRLSPHGRFGQVFNVIGAALLLSRRDLQTGASADRRVVPGLRAGRRGADTRVHHASRRLRRGKELRGGEVMDGIFGALAGAVIVTPNQCPTRHSPAATAAM